MVLFSQGILRCSFISWLAVKNRLATGDMMRSWGMIHECTSCEERDETRDHLFFACPYYYTVWDGLAGGLLGSGIDSD